MNLIDAYLMTTRRTAVSSLIGTTVLITLVGVAIAAPSYADMSYLDNGVIRLGVDLDLGGSITYLADSEKRINVVNSYDWGRQIQMSFYSGPKPYTPEGKQPSEHWKGLGWNPIQSGDYFGNRARVIAHRNDGKTLYVKCVPMHWPLNNEPAQCTFESWIELKANTAHVRCRINNNRTDKTQYPARGQELPAVYVNGYLHRLMTYSGPRPFTDDKLTRITKRWGTPDSPNAGYPWDTWQATENWAAMVNDDGWGLGIWTPGTYVYDGGFFGRPGAGGPKDAPTCYVGPRHTEILDHNIQHEYGYVLILGDLKAIRRYVYDRALRPAPPDYHFDSNREHWHYVNCRDTGWPIRGELHILLEGAHAQLIGPPEFWRAQDAPKLYIRAAFHTNATQAKVFWKNFGDMDFSEKKSLAFTVQADGRYRAYELDLASSPRYTGVLTGLRLDPAILGGEGGHVRIKTITLHPPTRP